MDSKEKSIELKIGSIPTSPGIYIYKNAKGEIIYIGKAKNLRSRVKQYFQNHDTRPQIPYLLKELVDLDYTVVPTELESLYLERTLIQKHHPKYNIELRDDKSYTFLAFDYSTEIPQILMTRRIEENTFEKRYFYDESKNASTTRYQLPTTSYFGPYSAAYKVRDVLKTIRYIFPYCSNTKVSQKPCFYYHLHRCPGVCIGQMSLLEYREHLEKVKMFLKGNISQVKKQIYSEMRIAASKRLYEKAARLRNQAKALELIEQRQNVILPKKVSWDVIAQAKEGSTYCINLFKVREGKLTDKENFILGDPKLQIHPNDTNILQIFLEDYYTTTSDRPDKIYLETKVENPELISALLKDRFGKKTNIGQATKNEPLSLLKISKENAQECLRRHLEKTASENDKTKAALNELKEVLELPKLPIRIECFDISNIQGTNAVGSMVVFVDGKPAKSQYRKFKIRTKETPDDFAMMQEMLERRFARSDKLKVTSERDLWPVPDLIVIDGGKGQLSSVLEALKKFQISNDKFQMIGLAKRIEEIFLPNQSQPIILGHDQPGLQLLQRLRDEAHRFGITYHRQLRSKQAVKSALDEIPGIGPKTKKLLKLKFGTVSNIKNASLEELKQVVGEKLAEKIKSGINK